MPSQIQILEKPDWVSWDEIHNIVIKAHENNRKNGVDVRNAHLQGQEIKRALGNEGKCFIALDTQNGEVIGTCSVTFHNLDSRVAKGKFAYDTFDAVLPNYTGHHIFSKLDSTRYAYIKEMGCDGIYMKIAEGNVLRRQIAEKEGFSKVQIARAPYAPHNYIVYVKWLKEKPYPDYLIKLRFLLSWLILHIKLIIGKTK